LKDELTVEQLQLIKSICQGKLDEIQGSQNEKPILNGKAECAQESNEKPQTMECNQSDQHEEQLQQA